MYEAITEIRMIELTNHINNVNFQLATEGVSSFNNPMYAQDFGMYPEEELYDEPINDIEAEPIYGYDNENIKNERFHEQQVIINDTYEEQPLPPKMNSFRGRGSQTDV